MRTALLAIAVAIAVGTVLLVASGSDLRRSGTSNVPVADEVERLAPGERICQRAEIPGGTEQLAVPAATASGAPARLLVTVRNRAGRVVASGRTRGVAPDGDSLARLSPAPRAGVGRVCVTNAGRETVKLLGYSTAFGIEYYKGKPQSWWGAAPSIARHFGFGKAGFVGAWAFWAALALIAAAWIAGWRALADSGARP